jgi:TfoX/Sxy family transcriptional regulator of competence genes
MDLAKLQDDVRDELAHLQPFEEKRMFGGIGFMWNGNLVCATSKRGLMVRLEDTTFAKMLGTNGAEPMTMGGRSSKNWMRIPPNAVYRKSDVRKWLEPAIAFVGTLPPK